MVENRRGIDNYRMRYRGMFDLHKLLNNIRTFLMSNKYEYNEPKYKYKEGQEYEIDIKADRKINYYIKFEIPIAIRIKEAKDVEVVKNGEKYTAQQGFVTVETTGFVLTDWQKSFKGSLFLEELQKFLEKFIMHRRLKFHWDSVVETDVRKLNEVIKESLGYET